MSTLITFNDTDKKLASVSNLGFTSYSDRRYEPQTQNTFAFEFLFDPAQVAYIVEYANKQISNSITGAEPFTKFNYKEGLREINETLNQSLANLTSPTKNIGQVVIDYFNSQIKFAGKPTYNNASITFNTLIGLGTKNVLAAWSDLCLSERTLKGGWARTESDWLDEKKITSNKENMSSDEYLDFLFPHTGYKVDGIMLECARDGTIVNQWKYVGMWLQSFTPGNFNMSSSNSTAQTSATIVVDQIKQVDISYISTGRRSKLSNLADRNR